MEMTTRHFFKNLKIHLYQSWISKIDILRVNNQQNLSPTTRFWPQGEILNILDFLRKNTSNSSKYAMHPNFLALAII